MSLHKADFIYSSGCVLIDIYIWKSCFRYHIYIHL